MKPFLIILAGHVPDNIRARMGDFDHWLRLAMQQPLDAVRVVDASCGEKLPAPGRLAGAVISGSPAMVTESHPWSDNLAGWVRAAMDDETPLMGVCYGHQLMAKALGGQVADLPDGWEIGTKEIRVLEAGHSDPIVARLPARFAAHTSHMQTVVEPPSGATVLAASDADGHHVLRYGPHAMSTQLHPEFSTEVMRACIRRRKSQLSDAGMDVLTLLRGVRAAPHARKLLRYFAIDALSCQPSTTKMPA